MKVRGWLSGQSLLSQPIAPGTWCSKDRAAQPVPEEGFCLSGEHLAFPILGRKRASELMAKQNMVKGKGRREAAAGLGTVFKTDSSDRYTTTKT